MKGFASLSLLMIFELWSFTVRLVLYLTRYHKLCLLSFFIPHGCGFFWRISEPSTDMTFKDTLASDQGSFLQPRFLPLFQAPCTDPPSRHLKRTWPPKI